ncbi:beta-galactosidase [Candidatus Pacearchaeota archaeon]|nr:beta-galactosidase [Candidatus Pacearchaeota archaeon]
MHKKKRTWISSIIVVIFFIYILFLASKGWFTGNIVSEKGNTNVTKFIIGVWAPREADLVVWKERGINMPITPRPEPQLSSITRATYSLEVKNRGMQVMMEVAGGNIALIDSKMESFNDGTFIGWMQRDEPDLQTHLLRYPNGSFDVEGSIREYINHYKELKKISPNTPVLGNFAGWEVLNMYKSAAVTKSDWYRRMFEAADWLSADAYIMNTGRFSRMDLIGEYLDKIQAIAPGKPVMAFIESSDQKVDLKGRGPTPQEMKAEIWLAVIHGAKGIFYFPQEIGTLPKFPAGFNYTFVKNVDIKYLNNVTVRLSNRTIVNYSAGSIVSYSAGTNVYYITAANLKYGGFTYDRTTPELVEEMKKQNTLLTVMSPVILSPGRLVSNSSFRVAERTYNGEMYKIILNLNESSSSYEGNHYDSYEVKIFRNNKIIYENGVDPFSLSLSTKPVDTMIPSAGKGLKGEYYQDMKQPDGQFARLALTRIDPAINFDWKRGSPDNKTLEADSFTVRWTGKIFIPKAGNYTFFTKSDDGIVVWIDDQKLINQWYPMTANVEKTSPSVSLKSGDHAIKVEYFERRGDASVKISWQGPGIGKQPIDSTYFSH